MNKEVLDVIKTRRSIRKYRPEQIWGEELDAVLEAGTYAPTGMGKQSPVIVAVQREADINKLARMNAEIMGSQGNPYYGAPTIVLVFADGKNGNHVQDASCVLENMMLAAHALGLGTCWINREKEMFGTEEGKALMEEWGLDQGLVGVGALALGYPEGDAPAPAPRKPDYIRIIR